MNYRSHYSNDNDVWMMSNIMFWKIFNKLTDSLKNSSSMVEILQEDKISKPSTSYMISTHLIVNIIFSYSKTRGTHHQCVGKNVDIFFSWTVFCL